jgi:hypothetical protein
MKDFEMLIFVGIALFGLLALAVILIDDHSKADARRSHDAAAVACEMRCAPPLRGVLGGDDHDARCVCVNATNNVVKVIGMNCTCVLCGGKGQTRKVERRLLSSSMQLATQRLAAEGRWPPQLMMCTACRQKYGVTVN